MSTYNTFSKKKSCLPEATNYSPADFSEIMLKIRRYDQEAMSSHNAVILFFKQNKTAINPSLAEHDMPCLSKQCRSRSVGF